MANTFVQGGNKAVVAALNTYADALGTTQFTYNKITDLAKTGHPNLENFSIAITHADLTSTYETFLQSNLVKVAQTEPIEITYTNNTVDSVAEAPSDVTPFFLLSTSGVINSTERRLYILYGYISDTTESNDAANTPGTKTDTFTSIGLPGQYVLTSTDINALFTGQGTIAADVTLTTGTYGSIEYLTV